MTIRFEDMERVITFLMLIYVLEFDYPLCHVQHTCGHTDMDLSSTRVNGHEFQTKKDEIAIKILNIFFDFEQSFQ